MGMIKKGSECSKCASSPINVPPSMADYVVLIKIYIGKCCVMKIHFPHCSNFEGMKVLVYEGEPPSIIDPHFCDEHASPIARFAPTDKGWEMACRFARSYE